MVPPGVDRVALGKRNHQLRLAAICTRFVPLSTREGSDMSTYKLIGRCWNCGHTVERLTNIPHPVQAVCPECSCLVHLMVTAK